MVNLRQARSEVKPQTSSGACIWAHTLCWPRSVCPTSIAVNGDFCLHRAFIPLRVRHSMNKWVDKYIVYCMVVNAVEEKLKHGDEVECRGSAELFGGRGKPSPKGAFEQRCKWTVTAPCCNLGWSTLGGWKAIKKKQKNPTAWDSHAVAQGPLWPEWSKLLSHKVMGLELGQGPVPGGTLWVYWKDFLFYSPMW